MLNDQWVIVQLIGQTCAWALLLLSFPFSIQILRYWQLEAATELQLKLERKSYLIGTALRFALYFQIITLLLFLYTANHHLSEVIRGAMCATGSLGINEYGYPLLYLKMGSVPFYTTFLILDYLDNREPEYPLTPRKYYIIPLLFILSTLDIYWLFRYFAAISPDVIATCCSVSFLVSAGNTGFGFIQRASYLNESLGGFVGLGLMLMILYAWQLWRKTKPSFLLSAGQLLLDILWLGLALYSLKYFFVKYIYGLPNHQCLFDIFFAKYYGIGYLLFASYYLIVLSDIALLCLALFGKSLSRSYQSLLKNWQQARLLGLLAALAIPLIYWLTWQGAL